jgi:hypothetical protein
MDDMVTALIPAASATPPPARAAPRPIFNPAALRLAIFLADAETSCVALAMDCFNAEMSAPRVTVSALMRRGWSQPEMRDASDSRLRRRYTINYLLSHFKLETISL